MTQSMFLIASLTLGYLSFMRIPLLSLSVISCAVHIPAMIYSSIYDAMENYKAPFIMIAEQPETRKLYSSLPYYFVPAVSVTLTYLLFTIH